MCRTIAIFGTFGLLLGTALPQAPVNYFDPPVFQSSVAPFVAEANAPLIRDVNNDGIPDVVVGLGFTMGVVCFLGVGGGQFAQPSVSYAPPCVAGTPCFNNGYFVNLIALTDLSGDGILDLVTVTPFGIQNWIGDGAGAFAVGSLLPYSYVSGFLVDDLDADGNPELIVGGDLVTYGATVFTIFSNASGSWSFNQTIPTLTVPGWPGTGDFNGDGWRDLIYFNAPSFYAMTGAGPGIVFSAPATFTMPASAQRVIADIDGDGQDDLIDAGSILSPFIRIRKGDAQTIFGPEITIPRVELGNIIRVDDVDRDGFGDLMFFRPPPFPSSGTTYEPTLAVRLGRPGNQLSSPVEFGFGATSLTVWTRVAAGDFDQDGDVDLFVIRGTGALPGSLPVVEFGFAPNIAVTGPGSGGGALMNVGTAALGNSSFAFGLMGAPPLAPVALGLSLGRVAQPSPFAPGIWLDLSSGQLLLPSGNFGFLVADAAGTAFYPVPIPSWPWLAGTRVFGQWAVLDMQGAVTINGAPFSLTEARAVVPW